ncbi:MAG TPA: SDR family oxidoreductase [Candidatus Deferrimicrobium sp.]|nr:SDR family oxidoreductase [Candidatus Deferrimicrobium sp.]
MDIHDSVALVTGANRGIGRAYVEALLERGSRRVYATARNVSGLGALVQLDPRRVIPLQLDITDVADVGAAAERASDVTLLVNNAGILTFVQLLDGDRDRIAEEMRVNFFGMLDVVRAFVPVIDRNAGGAIVNMLSLIALANLPAMGGYSASKAAAHSLTQALRAQLGGRGVTIHGVFPGAVDTDMIRAVDMPKTSPADVVRTVLDGVEQGVEDIFPDAMSQGLGELYLRDPKAVERQIAAL